MVGGGGNLPSLEEKYRSTLVSRGKMQIKITHVHTYNTLNISLIIDIFTFILFFCFETFSKFDKFTFFTMYAKSSLCSESAKSIIVYARGYPLPFLCRRQWSTKSEAAVPASGCLILMVVGPRQHTLPPCRTGKHFADFFAAPSIN